MKNNKGFTLVELLAMLVVLGILIGISVPNITGILNQQRETAFIEEASKLLSTAQMMVSTKREVKRPKDGNCIVFSIKRNGKVTNWRRVSKRRKFRYS